MTKTVSKAQNELIINISAKSKLPQLHIRIPLFAGPKFLNMIKLIKHFFIKKQDSINKNNKHLPIRKSNGIQLAKLDNIEPSSSLTKIEESIIIPRKNSIASVPEEVDEFFDAVEDLSFILANSRKRSASKDIFDEDFRNSIQKTYEVYEEVIYSKRIYDYLNITTELKIQSFRVHVSTHH